MAMIDQEGCVCDHVAKSKSTSKSKYCRLCIRLQKYEEESGLEKDTVSSQGDLEMKMILMRTRKM